MTKELTPYLSLRACFNEQLLSKSESVTDSEIVMMDMMLDANLYPDVVMVVPICPGSKQYKCFLLMPQAY